MSFTERAGLFPVLLLTGCASPGVVTGPPSGSVVDNYLTRSAADISAMQYRLHQSGPSAIRPGPPATPRTSVPLLSPPLTPASLNVSAVRSPGVSGMAGSGPSDGFILQSGAAPSLRAALRSIVPPGQSVVFDKTVAADAPELWRWVGNDRWPFVVNKMLVTHGLKATLNTKANTVIIEPVQRGQVAYKPVSSTLPTGSTGMTGQTKVMKSVTRPDNGRNPFRGDRPAAVVSGFVSSPSKPVAPATPSVRVWKIERGTTLRQGYEIWASKEECPTGKSAWSVRWDTEINYPIDYTLTFRATNFEDATAQLFDLWHRALFVTGYRPQCLIVISAAPPSPSLQPSQQE